MEDIFYTLSFKKVLLIVTITIYVFVAVALFIKYFIKAEGLEGLEDLPEDNGQNVDAIFGVDAFNKNQNLDEGNISSDDKDEYKEKMEKLTRQVIEEGNEEERDDLD